MKLPGWEKATSAEHYRQMIEDEYYRLKSERDNQTGQNIGLEEVKLRLFLSLLEKPERNNGAAVHGEGAVVHQFPTAKPTATVLLQDDQAATDQVA